MNDWEKEFDDKFTLGYKIKGKTAERIVLTEPIPVIKDFIRQQKELSRREGIEEAINSIPGWTDYTCHQTWATSDSYKEVVDTKLLITFIRSKLLPTKDK